MEFGTFTTIFYGLVILIAFGMIFEKQFIALEDKLDGWIKQVVIKSDEKLAKRSKSSGKSKG